MQKIPISYLNGLKGAYYGLATGTGASQNITIPAGYAASDLMVFEDGVLQLAGTHYTVSGTTLTGTFFSGAQLIIMSPGGTAGATGQQGPAGNMTGSNNLSEITNPATARFNLLITAATTTDYRNANANLSSGTRFLTSDVIYGAAQPVGIADATTITPDLNTFINAAITLGGDRTIANPTNLKVGQTGFITLIQDATGSRKVSWGDYYFFSGGIAPALSTAAGSIDRLYYTVTSSTSIDCSLATGMARSYDADAQAYFAAHTVQASSARKNLINALIAGLKSDGVWALFDDFWLLASHDEQSSLVNAARPTKVLLKYGSPFFTVDRGWAGSSSAGSITTNQLYTPDAKYYGAPLKRTTVGQGAFGVWENTSYSNGGYGIMGEKSNNNYDTIYMSGSTMYGRIGNNTSLSYTYSGATTGLRSVARTGTDSLTLYANGTNVATGSINDAGSTAAWGILGYGSNGNYNGTPNRIPFAFTGGNGFTTAVMSALYSRVNTYLTAIGAQ